MVDKISSSVDSKTANLNRSGRPKGAVNKTTKAAKEAIAEVFEGMGGSKALLKWAKVNEEKFYTVIWPKIIPLQLAGDPDNPLVHEIRRTIVRP